MSFGRAAAISIPALIADANHGAFVGEGQPIPMYALHIDTPTMLAPHKLASMWSMTREMVEGSNAEALTTEAMKRSIGLTLDAVLFDAIAGDAIRPGTTCADRLEKSSGTVLVERSWSSAAGIEMGIRHPLWTKIGAWKARNSGHFTPRGRRIHPPRVVVN